MIVLGFSGAVRRPPRATQLVDAITDGIEGRLDANGSRLDLLEAAPILFRTLRAGQFDAAGRAIIERVVAADVLVVGPPVYRGSHKRPREGRT